MFLGSTWKNQAAFSMFSSCKLRWPKEPFNFKAFFGILLSLLSVQASDDGIDHFPAPRARQMRCNGSIPLCLFDRLIPYV